MYIKFIIYFIKKYLYQITQIQLINLYNLHGKLKFRIEKFIREGEFLLK